MASLDMSNSLAMEAPGDDHKAWLGHGTSVYKAALSARKVADTFSDGRAPDSKHTELSRRQTILCDATYPW